MFFKFKEKNCTIETYYKFLSSKTELINLIIIKIIQFIEERLHMLNSGLGFSDEFEMEACNYSDKSGSKFRQQYREWTCAMRKEGSAFIKSVKDKVKIFNLFY